MAKILIVEDEATIARGLKFNFEQDGHTAVVVGDGRSAVNLVRSSSPPFDLIVLDLMLPVMSGYETLREIRSFDNGLPVLILSARTQSEDKTLAFDIGTDQYMTKPFALPELLSRVRNLLGRRKAAGVAATRPTVEAPSVVQFDDVRVDFPRFQVTIKNKTHDLTTMEMQLLKYFIEHAERVLSRAEILEQVWNDSFDVTTRTIDNFVMRLRKLIEPNPAEPRYILSVRGTGYRFVMPPPPPSEPET